MYEYFTCCYFGRSSSLMNVNKLVEIFNDCQWTGVRGTITFTNSSKLIDLMEKLVEIFNAVGGLE